MLSAPHDLLLVFIDEEKFIFLRDHALVEIRGEEVQLQHPGRRSGTGVPLGKLSDQRDPGMLLDMGKESPAVLAEAQDSFLDAASCLLEGKHVSPGDPEKDVEETAA